MMKIWSGRVVGLESALLVLKQGNVDMGVQQETNITDGIHARQLVRYHVWETEAESRHWVGIELVWGGDARWQVEGIINFVPNVESFLLMLGLQRWYVVREYVYPNNVPAFHCV